MKYFFTCFIIILFFSSNVFGQKITDIPVTSNWVFIPNINKDYYLNFRRYSLIYSGTGRFDGFRNTIVFMCALDKKYSSKFSIFVPREIKLKNILGCTKRCETTLKLTDLEKKHSTKLKVSAARNEIIFLKKDNAEATDILLNSKYYTAVVGDAVTLNFTQFEYVKKVEESVIELTRNQVGEAILVFPSEVTVACVD